MKNLLLVAILVIAGCADRPEQVELCPAEAHIHTWTPEEQAMLKKLDSQVGQEQMDRIYPVTGYNIYAPEGVDVIWENGERLTNDELMNWTDKCCIHDLPANWRCDLCPYMQRVYPLSSKAKVKK